MKSAQKPKWHGMESAPKDRPIIVGRYHDDGKREAVIVFWGTHPETGDTQWVQARWDDGEGGLDCLLFVGPQFWTEVPDFPERTPTMKGMAKGSAAEKEIMSIFEGMGAKFVDAEGGE